jgi:hypothetical protein
MILARLFLALLLSLLCCAQPPAAAPGTKTTVSADAQDAKTLTEMPATQKPPQPVDLDPMREQCKVFEQLYQKAEEKALSELTDLANHHYCRSRNVNTIFQTLLTAYDSWAGQEIEYARWATLHFSGIVEENSEFLRLAGNSQVASPLPLSAPAIDSAQTAPRAAALESGTKVVSEGLNKDEAEYEETQKEVKKQLTHVGVESLLKLLSEAMNSAKEAKDATQKLRASQLNKDLVERLESFDREREEASEAFTYFSQVAQRFAARRNTILEDRAVFPERCAGKALPK